MLPFCIRFVYHLVRQTEGLHWGVLLACMSALAVLVVVYLLICRSRTDLSRSIAFHNVVMAAGVLCFTVVLFDFTLGRRAGEVISHAPDLTLFDWVFDPEADRFKQALYAFFNIALFMPVAGFLSVLWDGDGRFVPAVPIVVLLLFGSASVEVVQVTLHLGCFQLEDIVCNLIGAVLGIALARCICRTRAEV